MSPVRLRIAELRAMKGWSQGELARQSGVARSVIARLEGEEIDSVHLPSLEKLAKVLGCDPGYLIVSQGDTLPRGIRVSGPSPWKR